MYIAAYRSFVQLDNNIIVHAICYRIEPKYYLRDIVVITERNWFMVPSPTYYLRIIANNFIVLQFIITYIFKTFEVV